MASTTFYLPYIMLVVAAIGAAISHIRPLEPCIHPAFGFIGVATMMYFILFFGTWSGYPRAPDLQQFALGGLVPHNDAGLYYLGTFEVGYTGRWGWVPSTRPLGAAFRDIVTGLGGLHYRPSIIIQTLLVSASLSFAAWRIANWIGPWSSIAFVAFILIATRPYLGTAMTEPLGLVWSLLAVAFMVDALRTSSFPSALLAIVCVSASQLVRTGTIFVVFALVTWAFAMSFERRAALRNLALIGVAASAPWILSKILGALYGDPNISAGWNVHFVLCALARGTSWVECRDTLTASGFSAKNLAEFAPGLAALAWQSFTANPWIMFNSLKANAASMIAHTPSYVLGAYNLHFTIPHWIGTTMVAATLPGLIIHFRRARRSERLLWVLLALTIGIGAIFVWAYDGWRSLFATHPFVILLLVIGLRTANTTSARPVTDARRATIALCGAAIVFLKTPALLHRAMAAAPSDQYDTRSVEGFLLIPDDAPAPDVPFLRASRFAHIVLQTGIEGDYGAFLAPVTQAAPKAVFWATLRGQRDQTTHLFIGPPEVLTHRDVISWRFIFAEPSWNKKNSLLRVVERAEALR